MKDYQNKFTKMTLREGIQELRFKEGIENDVAKRVNSEMTLALEAHDAVHVIFGCNTDMKHEALAHFTMIFCTDVQFNDMKKVAQNKTHKEIVSHHSKKEILKVLLGVIPDLISVLKIRYHMKKKWPWFGHQTHLDKPLDQLRSEFGIQLGH